MEERINEPEPDDSQAVEPPMDTEDGGASLSPEDEINPMPVDPPNNT